MRAEVRMRGWWIAGFAATAALVGCEDKAEDSGAAPCTLGTLTGTLTGPSGGAPEAGSQVRAVDDDGTGYDATVEDDGSYRVEVPAGRYTLHAHDDLCWSEDAVVEVEACGTVETDLAIDQCDTADKPNLYLYPARDTATQVQLSHGPKQRVFASDPPYGQGWAGVAHPDGSFTSGGARAPFLFYELSLRPWQGEAFQRDEGWCLPEEGAVDAMAELLGLYGFDARERLDFVEGWEHDLPASPAGYAVYPQRAVEHAGRVHIRPALPLYRLWLLVEEGDGCALDAPWVDPARREGPHAVEWGVVLHGFVR
jgi:hypothetical protein